MAWPFPPRKLVEAVVIVSICGLSFSTLRVCKESSSSFMSEQDTSRNYLSTLNENKIDTVNSSIQIATHKVVSTAMTTKAATTTTTTNFSYANTSTSMNNKKIDQAPQDDLFNFSPPFPDIKIQYPVFVTSLYKSGTTSVHMYFYCGKQRTIHNQLTKKYILGSCFMENVNVSNDNETLNAKTGSTGDHSFYSNAHH
jgi:hypothetical protein